MRDSALYLEWREGFSSDSKNAEVEIQEWLRSGWLRICYPSVFATDSAQRPPFDPFGAFAHDEDSTLSLMVSLRDMSSRHSAEDAVLLRRAVSAVICSWDFTDQTIILAMRLSFGVGVIFNCTEVCDVLVGKAQTLIQSPQPVITGLSDMAGNFGMDGRCLVERLVAASCESDQVAYLPYLLVRLIELSPQADPNKQRDLILDSVERYGYALARCGDSIDALEALTDIFVSELRLIEGVLTSRQLERLETMTVYLDSDAIMSIPQLRDAVALAPHQGALIKAGMDEIGDLENCLLLADGGRHE